MSTLLRTSESGLLLRGQGKLKNLVINSHSSGTVKIYDGTEGGAPAVSTLTSAGACAPADYAITELTSSGASVPGSHAVSVFTSSGVVIDGETITIGSIVYTAKATPASAYDVAMGANAEAFLANLKKAINGTGYGDSAGYALGTVAHPDVVAVASDATTLTIRGRVPGTSLNTKATTETFTNGSWPDTTLGGGTGASDAGVTTANATVTIGSIVYTIVDELSENYGATAVAYQVKKGASEATMLDNLKLAVNGTGTAGTHYSTGTVAHPTVIATTNTDTVQTFRSRFIGTASETTAINAIVTTETLANTAFADTTLGGGTGNSNPAVTTDNAQFVIGSTTYTAVLTLAESMGQTAVPFQVLWVTSEAVFLDNVKKAINASGISGTDYSTGTYPHPLVIATTNTDTTQVIQARNVGTAGNSIATTETLGNYSWTSTVMASGTGATGKVMHETITFSAVATTGERTIDFGAEDFVNGLYITIGGTADLSFAVDQY